MLELERFFWANGDPALLMMGEYHYGLVALSVLIAILVSCIAMQIAGIARDSHTALFRQMAIATGSLALGAGIWSMHFIGMLAFKLCTPVSYDPFLTALSVVPAILASWIALEMLAKDSVSPNQLMVGGVLMGAGIGAMHYSGMGAMQMAPMLRFDPLWFAISIVVSVVLAWLALWLRFGLHQSRYLGNGGTIALSGTAMGVAVASMHYVAMNAARFIGEEVAGHEHSLDTDLIIGITIVTVVLGGIVLAVNLSLRFRMLYKQLHLSEARQKAVFDTAVDGIITIDRRGIIVSVNPSVERLFGWEQSELIGRNIKMLMPDPQRSAHDQYLANYLSGGPKRVIGIGRETTAMRKDGSIFPIRLAVGELRLDDLVMFVGFITDISEQKRIEQLLEREATHDALTDLPNRRRLSASLPRAMARADRTGGLIGLLFIDLDGFKKINDDLGHDIGDELLKEVAQRLLSVSRRSDLVVRLAGDEFVMVLEGLHADAEARQVAEKTLAALCEPMDLEGHTVTVRASIGMAFYRAGCGLSAEAVLHQADLAMYAVKKRGKCSIASLN
ncbi:diguanylate cyclase domain-containing protein [Pseudothauera nasutitermitis]|nr:diguanylate cyclase [Pseudothauera nasutitermitis]